MTPTAMPPGGRGHAKFSPSSADTWRFCPGAADLCQGLPDDDTPFTLRGRMFHKVVENCLIGGRHAAFYQASNQLTDDEVIGCQLYINEVKNLAGMGPPPDVEMVLHHYKLADFWGTCDAVLWQSALDPETIKIIDFKSGAGLPVRIEDSWQMRAYAVLAYNEAMDRTPSRFSQLKTVDAYIIQPFCDRVQPVQSVTWTLADISSFETDIQVSIDLAAPGVYVDGPHCRGCKGKKVCPRIQHHLLNATVAVKDRVAAVQLTDVQLAQILGVRKALAALLDEIEEEAERRLTAGNNIPGFKLVMSAGGHRKWANAAQVAKLVKDMGLDPYEPASVKSPAQMEKMMKKDVYHIMGLDEMTVRTEGRPVVVPESDKRKPWTPNVQAAEDFAGVAGEATITPDQEVSANDF